MKNNRLYSKILFSAFICVALLLQAVCSFQFTQTYAISSVTEAKTITNGNFNYYPNTTTLDTNPNGWTRLNASGSTSGVINVTATATTLASYNISAAENPGRYSDTLDKKVLMLNAKSKEGVTPKNVAYKSASAISLEAHSFYRLTVLAYTQTGAKGSIYLSEYTSTGLNDKALVANEYFTSAGWQPYNLYLATGYETKSVQIELMLGSKSAPSINAVFYDNVTLTKITEDSFLTTDDAKNKHADLNRYESPILNNNFETTDLTGWTKTADSDSSGAVARIMNVATDDTMESYGLEYLGQDNSSNNANALVIYSSNNSCYGLESQPITIPQHSHYKISVNVKVSTNENSTAYVALKENDDVLDFYKNQDLDTPEDFYSPVTEKISVSSNSNNKFLGEYTTVSFIVKGHPLFDTTMNLQLWLGYRNGTTEEVKSKGAVAFDNVRIEQLSYNEFSSYTTGSADKKVSLTTLNSASPSITNGYFNYSENDKTTLEFPVKAANWTNTSANKDETVSGIININTTHFNANKTNYGSIANPGKISEINDTNNVLMLWNKTATNQSITSPSFDVSASSFNELTFDVRSVATGAKQEIVNIYVLDANDNVVYVDENVNASLWTTYKALIRTDASSEKLSLKVSLGKQNDDVAGYIFLDNVKLNSKTMTEAEYAEYVSENYAIDYTNGRFNLKSDELNANNMYDSLAFTGTLETGNTNTAYAGIIDGKANVYGVSNSTANDNTLKNILAIETTDKSTYALIGNKTTDLTADTYYKFSVYIKTRLPIVTLEDDLVYGAEFSLNGRDEKITGIQSNEDWTLYEIFVHATSAASVSPRFALCSQDLATKGQAFFDNYKFETITDSVFTSAFEEYENNDIKTMLFIGDTDPVEEDEENDDANANNFDWLLIPSLIMSLAVVIALVGFILRKIKFKKWTKRKQNDYDRNKTLYRDVFRKDAEDRRNAQIKANKDQIEKYNLELVQLEKDNQERIKNERKAGKTIIDSKTQREFKAYASKHTAIKNKIERLEKSIENMNTDEYLLTLQKKMMTEQLKSKKETETKQESKK